MKQILLGMGGALLLVGALYFIFTPKKPSQQIPNNNQTNIMQPSPSQSQTPPTNLQITDETVGTGAEAKAGNTVSVNYIGTLLDGTKFDSSYDRGQPFSFVLGQGQVIQGWDQGLLGMKIGGKRKLVIPPSLGYGAKGAENVIPPNATLVFEVELLEVK